MEVTENYMPANTAQTSHNTQSQAGSQANPKSTEGSSKQPAQSSTGKSEQLSKSTASGPPARSTERGLSGLNFFSPGDFFANPFGVMRRMHEEMDRAFAEAFRGGGFGTAHAPSGQTNWIPAIEVSENKGNIVVHAELPGVRPEDVQVEVANDTLVLTGRRERSEQHEEGGVKRSERMYGSFYRAIPLPEGTDPEKAHAEFKQGVLEISMPAAQPQQRGRRIPISGAETSAKKATA